MSIRTLPCMLKAWEKHETELRHWLEHQLHDQDRAADVLHDLFLKVVSQGRAFCDIENPRAWLFQVARNSLIDLYRHQQRLSPLSDTDPSCLSVSESECAEIAAVDALSECLPRVLSELDPSDATIIKSCDIEGMHLQTFADLHHLSLTATKSRIQRARKKLREQLICQCQVRTDETGSVCCFTPRSPVISPEK